MKSPEGFALDKSARNVDVDGRLHVQGSHISKAAINPYYGREIPGYDSLGLAADKVYRMFRDPVELEKGAATFARLPILREHVPVTVDSPQPDLVVGTIGSEIKFNSPYLDADLCFWDATAIAGIETDTIKELSCGYRYVPVMEPGNYQGSEYDGRMTEIRGNHLALVEVGRAGADVVVADRNPFPTTVKETAMKMTKLGKALFVALGAAYPILAQDSATPAIVGGATAKTFDKPDVAAKLMALDAAIDSNQLDSILDAILEVEQSPEPVEPPAAAKDDGEGSPVDQLRALLAGKVDDETINAACGLFGTATDEDPDDMDKDKDDEKLKTAMDSFKRELRDAEDARREVRETVGDVLGMDSAAEIYGFALDHMKVDHAGVEGAPALRALFKVASAKANPSAAPRIAQDAATATVKQFPGAARFRQA